MYPKLQTVLQQCLDRGRKPFSLYVRDFALSEDGIEILERYGGEEAMTIKSYHDLFSKESGLMEFVKWKVTYKELAHKPRLDSECGIVVDWSCGDDKSDYHYMVMGPMTAEEKIQYFLDNIVVDNG